MWGDREDNEGIRHRSFTDRLFAKIPCQGTCPWTTSKMKKKVARDRAKKARRAWAEKYEGTEKAKEWRRLAAQKTNAKRYGIMRENEQG